MSRNMPSPKFYWTLIGYDKWAGQRMTADDLTAIFQGLQANSLTNYSHVLTGMYLLTHLWRLRVQLAFEKKER